MQQQQPKGRKAEKLTLHVIFHGLCAFVVSEVLQVLVPEVPEMPGPMGKNVMGHEYFAGIPDFPNEKDPLKKDPLKPLKQLNKGETYRLFGVSDAEDIHRFDAKANGILPLGSVDPKSPNLHCSFQLPRPDKIHSLRRVRPGRDCKGTFFKGPGSDLIQQPKELALVQVLVYSKFDQSGLHLDPLVGWTPSPNQDLNAVNLHIFAEPRGFMQEQQAKEHVHFAFPKLVSLFPGLGKLTVCTEGINEPGQPLPPGLEENDLKTMGELLEPLMLESPMIVNKPPSHCMSLVAQNPSAGSHHVGEAGSPAAREPYSKSVKEA